MASDQDIRDLLRACRQNEAFEMLLGAYEDKVFRLALSMLGDRASAEDAAQEIFIRIWKALGKYRGESALGTWIYSVARNFCLTAISKRAARRTAPIEQADQGGPEPPDHSPDVLRMAAHLPDSERQALMLFYMEDRSYAEVAELLGVPLGTVKTRIHRARKELVRMLKEAEDGVRRV